MQYYDQFLRHKCLGLEKCEVFFMRQGHGVGRSNELHISGHSTFLAVFGCVCDQHVLARRDIVQLIPLGKCCYDETRHQKVFNISSICVSELVELALKILTFSFPSFLKGGNHKNADVHMCIRVSVRLRDGWMDHSETHKWYSLVSQDDARHLRFLKFFKMVDWRPFSKIQKMLHNFLNMRVRCLVCIYI